MENIYIKDSKFYKGYFECFFYDDREISCITASPEGFVIEGFSFASREYYRSLKNSKDTVAVRNIIEKLSKLYDTEFIYKKRMKF